MPTPRPTLPELITRKEADIESRLPGADARQPASNLNVLARVNAGGEHGLYGVAQTLEKQILADTADSEYLERHAGVYEITKKDPSQADGFALFTGSNGIMVPADLELQRADETLYVTTAAVEIAGGSALVPVRAVAAGVAGNLAAGVTLKMTGTVPGVNTVALVAEPGLTGGAEVEGDASLLARYLTRVRRPPHGGNKDDYERWALEVPGVTRAWCKPGWFGYGTVGLMFVCDDAETPIPSAEKVAEVQAHVDAVRPVTAEFIAFAPTPKPINPVFTALSPNTETIQAEVVKELRALLRVKAEPGATIAISHIREAISTAVGEEDYTMPDPAANFTTAAHELAVLGTPTFPEVAV